MAQRTWLITVVSSGFGSELIQQLLRNGDRVVGTVRGLDKVADLMAKCPGTFRAGTLDVADTTTLRDVARSSAYATAMTPVMQRLQ